MLPLRLLLRQWKQKSKTRLPPALPEHYVQTNLFLRQTLEQQGEQRRFVSEVSRDMQRQELDTKPLTIGERAEAVMKSPLGIEPALANVPPEYRKQVTAAVETERNIREAMRRKKLLTKKL